jgi:hypothetical protein
VLVEKESKIFLLLIFQSEEIFFRKKYSNQKFFFQKNIPSRRNFFQKKSNQKFFSEKILRDSPSHSEFWENDLIFDEDSEVFGSLQDRNSEEIKGQG